jgi:hypothetical protein
VLPLLVSCSSFSEVEDAGSFSDGKAHDGKTHDDKAHDGKAHDGEPSNPDLGGKRAAGDCCAKDGDCASGKCYALGSGPSFCTKTCTTQPDDCPVGFGCDAKMKLCVPPVASYNCGPRASTAGPQPIGGCCGKKQDCVSGECLIVGADGQYFCSQTCTRSPDDCPPGFVCSTASLCATPGTSTCSFK